MQGKMVFRIIVLCNVAEKTLEKLLLYNIMKRILPIETLLHWSLLFISMYTLLSNEEQNLLNYLIRDCE